MKNGSAGKRMTLVNIKQNRFNPNPKIIYFQRATNDLYEITFNYDYSSDSERKTPLRSLVDFDFTSENKVVLMGQKEIGLLDVFSFTMTHCIQV